MLKIKGFRSRVGFGIVKGSVLKGGTLIVMGFLFFMSSKSFDIYMSSDDRFLNFFVKINMLFT